MNKNWGNLWADQHIERLKKGQIVQFRPHGNSMQPLIENGQLVTVSPKFSHLDVGDIVLVTIGKKQYVHLIKEKLGELRFLIGNNKGRINGEVTLLDIHGKVIKVED